MHKMLFDDLWYWYLTGEHREGFPRWVEAGINLDDLRPCLFFNFYAVPLEERAMEARFREAYRKYKSKVPRWFGKARS